MLLDKKAVNKLIRCPLSGSALTRADDALLAAGMRYPIVNGYPVLIPFEKSVLSEDHVQSLSSPITRNTHEGVKGFLKALVSPPNAKIAEHVALVVNELTQAMTTARVLVVGGAAIGQGMQPIYAHPRLEIVAFDIYASPHIQFLADAHYIPLADDSFDAVIVQAVLEHVLEPDAVVAEIRRVLKPKGLVYATTPFLLHVHEGAYDFTRFTESGLRYLFRDFALIRSGALGGVGTQLLWALDGFGRGLFRSRTFGKLMKLLFFWLLAFDRLSPEPYNIDAASEVFFLGRKHDRTLSPKEAVAHYQGAQR